MTSKWLTFAFPIHEFSTFLLKKREITARHPFSFHNAKKISYVLFCDNCTAFEECPYMRIFPLAQSVHCYFDHALSVLGPSSLIFHIFYLFSATKLDKISTSSTKFVFFRLIRKPKWPLLASDWLRHFYFFCATAWLNPSKIDRKQNFNVLYQVYVSRTDRKTKMAGLASDCLRYFQFLCNHLTEFHRNLTGSKISTSSTKFAFFWLIGRPRWPPWPLICLEMFNFYSAATERNSMKLVRRQVLNIFHQVCVFPLIIIHSKIR